MRVAEATGCAGVVAAAGSADFFHPRAVRASAGSVLRIPVSGRVSFEAFARDAAQAGRVLCGAVPSGGDDPFSAPPPAASVIVIGAEGTGLPAGAYRYLDRRLTIPMAAPVDSLNAAVAAALLLYASPRRLFPEDLRLKLPDPHVRDRARPQEADPPSGTPPAETGAGPKPHSVATWGSSRPPPPASLDDQAVSPDDDLLRILHGLRRRQHRDLDAGNR